jgi:hypothetical protein
MASNKGNSWEDLFAPLDFVDVPLCPGELHFGAWTTQVPMFNGNPWLASDHFESFMKYVVDTNMAHEDILMKEFAYSLQGGDVQDWYCILKPKEIKSFPRLMKRFQKHWIYGYEEVEDYYFFHDVLRRIGDKIDNLMMEYDDNPSSDLLGK